jgi:predicted RNA-binding Zn-ribbon protein involved in translation (DUF1610 family)
MKECSDCGYNVIRPDGFGDYKCIRCGGKNIEKVGS